MKVGDYVRTDTGIITKIKNIIDFKKDNEFEYLNYNDVCVLTTESDYFHDVAGCRGKIIKSSQKIRDLIEVGDYGNGLPVCEITDDEIYVGVKDSTFYWFVSDIYSVVTKEHFSQMEYRIGERLYGIMD